MRSTASSTYTAAHTQQEAHTKKRAKIVKKFRLINSLCQVVFYRHISDLCMCIKLSSFSEALPDLDAMGYAQSVWTNRRKAPGMQRVRGREMEQKNEWEAIGGWDISTLYAIIHIFRIHHLAKCGSAPYAWYHGCHCHCLFSVDFFFVWHFFPSLSLYLSPSASLSPFFFFRSLLPHAKNLMNRHRIIFCLFPSPENSRAHIPHVQNFIAYCKSVRLLFLSYYV